MAVLTGSGVAVVLAQRAAKSAERERMVKAFGSDVFRVKSRAEARNTALRPASPQALIEVGAQLIQQRFAGQPESQAELFGVVGEIFADMGPTDWRPATPSQHLFHLACPVSDTGSV